MKVERIKLVGQLIDENPVVLDVVDNTYQLEIAVEEAKSAFPDILLTAEWGYFKKPISYAKQQALANLMSALCGGLSRVIASVSYSKQLK